MLTKDDLDSFERSAEPVRRPDSAGVLEWERIAAFERTAEPYRSLLRSARLLLMAGRRIGPDLETELRAGARALVRARERLGCVERKR